MSQVISSRPKDQTIYAKHYATRSRVIQLKTSTFNFGIIIQQALNIRISKAEAEKNMQAVKP